MTIEAVRNRQFSAEFQEEICNSRQATMYTRENY